MVDDQHGPTIVWRTLSLQCADADALAHFYSHLFGWPITGRGEVDPVTGGSRWVRLWNPSDGVCLACGAMHSYEPPTWPEEPGRQVMMMHFEVGVDDVQASVARALAAGGSVAPWQPPDRDPATHRVMMDPAGHPLCLFHMVDPHEKYRPDSA